MIEGERKCKLLLPIEFDDGYLRDTSRNHSSNARHMSLLNLGRESYFTQRNKFLICQDPSKGQNHEVSIIIQDSMEPLNQVSYFFESVFFSFFLSSPSCSLRREPFLHIFFRQKK